MCVFKKEHFGKKLHPLIIAFLADYTTKDDRDGIASALDLGQSTLKGVCNGSLNLSERNSQGVVALMKKSVANCGNLTTKTQEDGERFKKVLQKGVAEVLDGSPQP